MRSKKYLSIDMAKDLSEHLNIVHSEKILQVYNDWNKLRMKNRCNCFINKIIIFWPIADISLSIYMNINLQILLSMQVSPCMNMCALINNLKKKRKRIMSLLILFVQ